MSLPAQLVRLCSELMLTLYRALEILDLIRGRHPNLQSKVDSLIALVRPSSAAVRVYSQLRSHCLSALSVLFLCTDIFWL